MLLKELDGVGPKTLQHWKESLEGSSEETSEEEQKEGETAIVPAEGKAKKVQKSETEIVEPTAEVIEEGAYHAKKKPELDARTKELLAKRYAIGHKRPQFLRQEWFRFPRLGLKWRKPRGMHSKMRMHYKYRPAVVSIGYRGPKEVRGLHSSGFKEVLIHNPKQLDGIDPKLQAVRIGSSVGTKKRLDIEAKADGLGIRVLNRMG